jgi:hypothetical protein
MNEYSKLCDDCIRQKDVTITHTPAGVSPDEAIKAAQMCSDCYLDKLKPKHTSMEKVTGYKLSDGR